MKNKNLIILKDSYKFTHPSQYPKKLTDWFVYGEPRKGGKYKEICFLGLQYYIEEYLLPKITTENIDQAEKRAINTFGTSKYFDRTIWEKVRDLGYLPIRIKSVPEGTILEEGNVCFTIERTEEWFIPYIGGLETLLLNVWYPSTIASRCLHLKKSIIPFFEKSVDSPQDFLPFAILDFGMRGVSCPEQAGLGGLAHLAFFIGSDNEAANSVIEDYYRVEGRLKSVFATEHSTATSFGEENELEYLLSQLEAAGDDMPISVVIDSYDADNFIQNVAGHPEAVKIIKNRTGRTIFRNDSGDALRNALKHSDILSSIFGLEINSKGYKVIGNNVALLQADGMDEETIPRLFNDYLKAGWSACNLNVGSGGGLLQKGVDRDTCRWALKASYAEKDGVPFNIQKRPKTDPSKTSKSGKLKLHKLGNTGYMTIESSKETPQNFNSIADTLMTVYENGNFFPDKFENIIERANSKL